MSCKFFPGVRVRVGGFGIHIRLIDIVRVVSGFRVCGYVYNQGWGLHIHIQLTAYAEKR